jgi:hypothetical protein
MLDLSSEHLHASANKRILTDYTSSRVFTLLDCKQAACQPLVPNFDFTEILIAKVAKHGKIVL